MSVMTGDEISKKNGLGTWKLLGLAIITGGMFFIYWMKKMTELVEAFSGKRVWEDNIFIIYLFVWTWLSLFPDSYDPDGVTVLLLFVFWLCMWIQWSFSMRREITLYAITKLGMSEYKMNAFYTFIFNVYYINYCLNDLGDEELRQRAREDLRARQMKNSELRS